jgi:hypothetical protein
METLYLLVDTTQPSFGPLGDVETLRGFRDLLNVLTEAGVPVVAGKRASSGLLLLSLGAQGWGTGVSSNLMNMSPHPETAAGRQGQPIARIYVPSLLNLIAVDTYVLMRASSEGHRVALTTPQALALLATNPDLDNLTTAEAVLLLQHNLVAQKEQVDELASRPSGQRVALMQSWVDAAVADYAALPPGRQPSDNPGFLRAWADVLS